MIMPQCIKEEEEEGKGGIFQSVTKWRQYEPFIQTVTLAASELQEQHLLLFQVQAQVK